MKFYKFKNYITCLLVICFCVSNLFAQTKTMPYTVQAIFFKKLFSYIQSERNGASDQNKVAIVYDESSSTESRDGIAKTLQQEGIKVVLLKSDELTENNCKNIFAFYLVSNTVLNRVILASKSFKILSVSGDISLIESGKVSVVVGVEDKKPKVYVNLNQLKLENQQFPADFLDLPQVKVIK